MGDRIEMAKEYEKRTNIYEPVAVMTWFTAEGVMMPKLIKYEDKSGTRHTVDNIDAKIISENQTTTVVYKCKAMDYEFIKEFRLIFFVKDHKWKICFQ